VVTKKYFLVFSRFVTTVGIVVCERTLYPVIKVIMIKEARIKGADDMLQALTRNKLA
jgi:hypothetical protein